MKKFSLKCKCCNKDFAFNVTDEQYKKYLDGTEPIQKIFPELSPHHRELFISGMCGRCFDEIFDFDD